MTLLNLVSSPDEIYRSEAALLGAVMSVAHVMDDVQYLQDTDFMYERTRLAWNAIKYLYQNGRPYDYRSVTNVLIQYKRLEDVGGSSFLMDCVNACGSAVAAVEYAKFIRDNGIKSRALDAAEKIKSLTTEYTDSATFTHEIETLISKIQPHNNIGIKNFADREQDFLESLDRHDSLIPTGFREFDEWAGGVARGDLKITAARPSVGKTAKSLYSSVKVAKMDIGDVLFFSQEMKAEKLMRRIVSAETGIAMGRFRNLEEWEREKIMTAYRELKQYPLYIHDGSRVTIDDIRATVRQHQRQHKRNIAMIVVDYLQIMKIPQGKNERRDQAIGRVTATAKEIAQEADCVFDLLCQLSREGVNGEPQLHHLRESGEIEQDADVVEFLWHDPEEKSNKGKVIQSTIAKGRDIGVNRFKYLFTGWNQRYDDFT